MVSVWRILLSILKKEKEKDFIIVSILTHNVYAFIFKNSISCHIRGCLYYMKQINQAHLESCSKRYVHDVHVTIQILWHT